MNNKVKNGQMAEFMFDLLGIKDVTKPWQKEKGTQVFELPFKTMYANGYKEVNRFTIYKSGYVRKMLVKDNGASYCCYQLNRTRVAPKYYKDYDLDGNWTGKYNRYVSKERIMIPDYEDRLVYLCNYILKNYYRNQTGASFYRINDYQTSLIKQQSKELHEAKCSNEQLPFTDEGKRYDDELCVNDIKVIINGHRYNLS